MTRTLFVAALFAFCAVSGCAAQDNQLEISNLRVGLVCAGAGSTGGSVCSETREIPITGQGKCVYNGEEHACTWYGFEFEYRNAQPGAELACVVTSNREADFGDPGGVRQENTNRFEFELTLERASGRFFNPQYTIFNPNVSGAQLEETVCSLDSRELFKFQWQLLHPATTERLDP